MKSVVVSIAVLLQFACSEDFNGATDSGEIVSPVAECLGTVYQGTCCEHATKVPDGCPGGAVLGPLSVSSGDGIIQGIVLSLEIIHPQAADLHIQLSYDADNDGVYDASSPVEIYLARSDLCDGEEFWACPVRLDGTYFFKDESWESFGEEASFKVFEGLPSTGGFYLTVTDGLEGDVGSVRSWGVFVEDVPLLAQE